MEITVFLVKDNETTVRQDIEDLFQPHRKRAGTSAPPMDFRRASTIEKGHGRLDKRSIVGSSLLADYSDWPGLDQVFKLERQSTNATRENRNTGTLWDDQFTGVSGSSQTAPRIDQRALGN
jgi:hypothetical protein